VRPICVVILASTLVLGSSASIPLKLDHVGICAYDLQSLQDAFASVGLSAEYGGAHATGGTHNALLGFDDGSYVELIALQKPGSVTDDRWNSLKPGASYACFWAVHTDDLKAQVDAFRKAKLETSDPQPGGRKKPDGTVLQWQTAATPDHKGGDILPFAIQDVTPRSLRIQPSTSVKGSELTGIKRVVIAVNDLNAAIALYRRAYGLGEPQLATNQDFAAKLAYFPSTAVVLAFPLSEDSWLSEHVRQFGQGPVAVLLGAKNVKRAADRALLLGKTSWFGSEVSWFPPEKLQGVRLGVISE
jgi:hypothetical protein